MEIGDRVRVNKPGTSFHGMIGVISKKSPFMGNRWICKWDNHHFSFAFNESELIPLEN